MFDDEEYVQSMIDAGAKGFFAQKYHQGSPWPALQALQAGKNYYSPELWEFFTRKLLASQSLEDEEVQLYPPGEGDPGPYMRRLSNKEIADRLSISERTWSGTSPNLLSKTNTKELGRNYFPNCN